MVFHLTVSILFVLIYENSVSKYTHGLVDTCTLTCVRA